MCIRDSLWVHLQRRDCQESTGLFHIRGSHLHAGGGEALGREQELSLIHISAAALVGAIAQKDPGTYTCKNQILKELEPEALDDTQIKTCLLYTSRCV